VLNPANMIRQSAVSRSSSWGRFRFSRRGRMQSTFKDKKGPQLPICEFVTILLFPKYLAKVSS
jgi:hypothetical protein